MTTIVNLFNGVNHISDYSRQLIERQGDYKVYHIDSDGKKFGFASTKPVDPLNPNTINFINFDKYVNGLLSKDKSFDNFDGNYIHSIQGTKTWSKATQHRVLSLYQRRYFDSLGLTIPEFHIFNTDSFFVRNTETAGSKGAGILRDRLGGDEVIITPTASNTKYPHSCTVNAFIKDGEVKDNHLSFSESRYRTYEDLLIWNQREDYTPLNDLYSEMTLTESQIKRINDISLKIAEVFKLYTGTFSLEMFCNADLTDFWFIECDFRLCDYTWIASSAAETFVQWVLETKKITRG